MLIGLPFDENSSFMRGAAEAPPLIRAALFSDASNMWSESGVDLSLPGLLGDAGDLVSDPGEDPFDAIERAIAELATRGLRPIALGGDHAISFPVVRALSAIHHGLSILHVDHPDLYDEFRQCRRSHACPFARIMESGLARKLGAGRHTYDEWSSARPGTAVRGGVFIAVNPDATPLDQLLNGMIFCNRTLGFVNAPAFIQRVVQHLQGMSVDVTIYQHKRDRLCRVLKEMGYSFITPDGAFYLFPKAPINDIEFVRELQKENILAVPGSGFGGPGFFRIAYCVDDWVIEGALPGFKRLADKCVR